MERPEKQILAGKKVVIVGSEWYTRIHKEDMELHGAVIEYPESNKDALIYPQHAEEIGREILAMEQKPDVVLLHHPQMDMHEIDGLFEDSPTIELARTLKRGGIPTLIVDQYGRDMTKTKETALRDAGATFREMFDIHYDEITTLLAYMANNKGKLTGFGAAAAR